MSHGKDKPETAKERRRRWRANHPEARRHIRRNETIVRLRKNKTWLLWYLSSRPCVDCGNTDVRVLQFDLNNPNTIGVPTVTKYVQSQNVIILAQNDVRKQRA